MASDRPGIEPARLTPGAGGEPFSETYGDYYSALDDPLAEARHVFLAGNDLPARWGGRRSFTVGETGFGTGLNFLVAWDAWAAAAPADARLHFVSVEKHPFARVDLGRIHRTRGHFPGRSRALLAQYPPCVPGFHRLTFDGGRVVLTLLFGDAGDVLPQLAARVDAWFLDGFAPARNPDMWTPGLYRQLARLSGPGATLATFTAAGHVRRGLQAEGFAMEKRPGFGRKREMLAGRHPAGGPAIHRRPERPWYALPEPAGDGPVAVIGAGLAGSHVAERLAARGHDVELVERRDAPGAEASGNHAGILMPNLARDWNPPSRIAASGFLHALRHLRQLDAGRCPPRWRSGGVLRLPRGPRHRDQLLRILEALALPADFVDWLDRAEASEVAGVPLADGGWHFPDGAWVQPASLCQANLEAHAGRIRRHFVREVAGLAREGDGWRLDDVHGRPVLHARQVVLANATDARRLIPGGWLDLAPVRGQVSLAPADGARARLQAVVCGEGYAIPPVDDVLCFGASFNKNDPTPGPTPEDHRDNLARLAGLAPSLAEGLETADLAGRAGQRATTADRLPVVGPVVDAAAFERDYDDLYLGRDPADYPEPRFHPGLHVISGLGARGLAWAPLAAELLAAQIDGDPLPLEKALVDHLNPARFLVRRLRRNPRDRH